MELDAHMAEIILFFLCRSLVVIKQDMSASIDGALDPLLNRPGFAQVYLHLLYT